MAFCVMSGRVVAQTTIVSEMGPVMFYNSLDSARSALLNHIARRAYCVLLNEDSSHTIHLKLDLGTRPDSVYRLELAGGRHLGKDRVVKNVTGMVVPKLTDSLQVLDSALAVPSVVDTIGYIIRYDNLEGNAASLSDSALAAGEPEISDLGIYIRGRDTIINQEWILRLLDYGIRHIAALRATRAGGPPPEPAEIRRALTQRASAKLKGLMRFCR